MSLLVKLLEKTQVLASEIICRTQHQSDCVCKSPELELLGVSDSTLLLKQTCVSSIIWTNWLISFKSPRLDFLTGPNCSHSGTTNFFQCDCIASAIRQFRKVTIFLLLKWVVLHTLRMLAFCNLSPLGPQESKCFCSGYGSPLFCHLCPSSCLSIAHWQAGFGLSLSLSIYR